MRGKKIPVQLHVIKDSSRPGERGEGGHIITVISYFYILAQGFSLQGAGFFQNEIKRFSQFMHTVNRHPDKLVKKGPVKPPEKHVNILGEDEGVDIGIIP